MALDAGSDADALADPELELGGGNKFCPSDQLSFTAGCLACAALELFGGAKEGFHPLDEAPSHTMVEPPDTFAVGILLPKPDLAGTAGEAGIGVGGGIIGGMPGGLSVKP